MPSSPISPACAGPSRRPLPRQLRGEGLAALEATPVAPPGRRGGDRPLGRVPVRVPVRGAGPAAEGAGQRAASTVGLNMLVVLTG